jgi:hypothetical protein
MAVDNQMKFTSSFLLFLHLATHSLFSEKISPINGISVRFIHNVFAARIFHFYHRIKKIRMSQMDKSISAEYSNKLKVVHKLPEPVTEQEKDKHRRANKYRHWNMPQERPGYIKSKKHDCL